MPLVFDRVAVQLAERGTKGGVGATDFLQLGVGLPVLI